jgi:NADH-quinone oxidoreductase subunit H
MVQVKAFLKYLLIYCILAVIVAILFVIFQSSDLMVKVLKFFVFPGILFIVLGALFIDWYDRKLFARMQNRYGPRFIQPIFDMLKLLAKEDITPNGVDKFEFNLIPAVQVFLSIMVAFTVPVYIAEGLISFNGDLIFVLFLLALIGGSIFLLGWVTNNPYALIGGSRAATSEMAFEIPLALSLVGPALMTGSLRISIISTGLLNAIISKPLLVIPTVLCFFLSIISATAVLEKVPFDPAHAEVEIIGGWSIELTGKKLFFTRIANLILEFGIAGLIAAIFLGGLGGFNVDLLTIGTWEVSTYLISVILFVIKTCFVIFLITLMRTLNSRIRIDQLVRYFWQYYLPIGFIAILATILVVVN